MKRFAIFAIAVLLAGLGLVAQEPVQVAQGPVKPLDAMVKDHGKKKRGLKPTSRKVLAASPRYHPKVAAPTNYWRFPKKLNTWGNNQYGCCVTSESAFCRAMAGIYISEQEVIRWARANGVLEGADLKQVIDMQASKGFSQDGNIYGNGGGRLVNYSDAATFKAAIFEAGIDKGSISIGISADMLPQGAGNESGWFLSGQTNDENEDHCISVCGFGTAQQFVTACNAAYGTSVSVPSSMTATTQGYALYTWNTVGFAETSSCVGMMGEAWIRTPSTIIHGSGIPTPDEVFVGGDPTPGPGPIPPGPIPPVPTPITGTTTVTVAGPLGNWSGEVMPIGFNEAFSKAMAIATPPTPVIPPQPPTTIEGRVQALESGIGSIGSTLKEIQETLSQLKKEIGK